MFSYKAPYDRINPKTPEGRQALAQLTFAETQELRKVPRLFLWWDRSPFELFFAVGVLVAGYLLNFWGMTVGPQDALPVAFCFMLVLLWARVKVVTPATGLHQLMSPINQHPGKSAAAVRCVGMSQQALDYRDKVLEERTLVLADLEAIFAIAEPELRKAREEDESQAVFKLLSEGLSS